jgi:hypothetical protein
MNLILLISLITNPLHASFVQRKNGITLRVRDLSMQQDRKLIGSIGAREMKELNCCGIYPVLIELKNHGEQHFTFNTTSFSVPIYSPHEMAFKVPKINGKEFLKIMGSLLSLYGGLISAILSVVHAHERHPSFIEGVENCFGIKASLIASPFLLYFGIKGLASMCTQVADRQKDQEKWLGHWMLTPEGVQVVPNARIKKCIFLDKKTYQDGFFYLTLHAMTGENINFEVSLLP